MTAFVTPITLLAGKCGGMACAGKLKKLSIDSRCGQ